MYVTSICPRSYAKRLKLGCPSFAQSVVVRELDTTGPPIARPTRMPTPSPFTAPSLAPPTAPQSVGVWGTGGLSFLFHCLDPRIIDAIDNTSGRVRGGRWVIANKPIKVSVTCIEAKRVRLHPPLHAPTPPDARSNIGPSSHPTAPPGVHKSTQTPPAGSIPTRPLVPSPRRTGRRRSVPAPPHCRSPAPSHSSWRPAAPTGVHSACRRGAAVAQHQAVHVQRAPDVVGRHRASLPFLQDLPLVRVIQVGCRAGVCTIRRSRPS